MVCCYAGKRQKEEDPNTSWFNNKIEKHVEITEQVQERGNQENKHTQLNNE